MNWTLVAIIVILAICAIVGFKRGIVRMILSLVFSVVGFIAAIIITPLLTESIRDNTTWDDKIIERTEQYMADSGFLLISDSAEVKEIFPEVFQNEIDKSAEEYIEKGVDAYNDYIVLKVAGLILSSIIYIIVFLAIIIVCSVVGMVVRTIAKLPIIRTANDIGGMVVGLAVGLMFISLLFLVLMGCSNFSWAERIYYDIERSPLLTFMYNKNLILIIIAKIF